MAREATDAAAGEPDSGQEPGAAAVVGFPAALVLVLLLAAGALLVLSRQLPFDADNSYYAPDFGYATLPWVLGVLLPLVAVTQLVVLRHTGAWTVQLGAGLLGGVTLVQLEQVLSSSTLAADPDTGVNAGGPGWWLALLGTAVLVPCLVVMARRAVFQAERPGVGGTWRTVLGIVLVVGALFAWLSAFGDFYLWWPANGPGLLLAAVALPVVVLALNGAQRMAALAAVSVFGVWIAVSTVHSLLVDTYWSDVGSGGTVACSALVSVLACYVAQARLPRRESDRPRAGAAPRR